MPGQVQGQVAAFEGSEPVSLVRTLSYPVSKLQRTAFAPGVGEAHVSRAYEGLLARQAGITLSVGELRRRVVPEAR